MCCRSTASQGVRKKHRNINQPARMKAAFLDFKISLNKSGERQQCWPFNKNTSACCFSTTDSGSLAVNTWSQTNRTQSGENTHGNTSTYLANRLSRCVVNGSQLPRRKAVDTRCLQIGSLAENFRRASKEPLKGCARSEPDHVQGRFSPPRSREEGFQCSPLSQAKRNSN